MPGRDACGERDIELREPSTTFRCIVPSLARHFTCHLIDLPGVGQSESDRDAPIDFVSHAASLKSIVDAMGLTRYALLAHDSGGFVARLTAADDSRVTRIVLGNTEIPGHTPPLVAAMALLVRLPFGAKVLRTLLRSRAFRRSSLRRMKADPRVDTYITDDATDSNVDAARGAGPAGRSSTRPEALGSTHGTGFTRRAYSI